MIKWFLSMLLVCSIHLLSAQEWMPVGARSWGMGNASSTLTDVWSVFNNQGALAQIEKPVAGVYVENLYGLKELSKGCIGVAVPTKSGTWGLGLNHFGSQNFNRQMFGLVYSKKFGKNFSGGIKLDYLVTNQPENYGRQTNILVEAGIWYAATRNIKIGFHTYNPNRVKWSSSSDERLPGYAKLGIAWQVSEQVLIATEGVNDFVAGMRFRAGAEYKPSKLFTFRTGIETNPISNSFGVTYQYKNINIDFASAYHYVLGFSTRLGISFNLVKKDIEKNDLPAGK